MQTVVVFSSLTGNTKKIAQAVYEALPSSKDIYKVDDKFNLDKYDLIAIGYWVNKGTCDDKLKEVINTIHNKNVILFGTLGARDVGDYYETVKKRIEDLVTEDNKLLGHFLCQGKITEKLTARYEAMLKKNPEDEHAKEMFKNFETAKSHPNNEDIENVTKFIKDILNNI